MGYRIKTVSELTGIPKNTLVAWERRYGVVTPDRLPNGYRVYDDSDVALLVRLKNALDDGLKISEAVEVVTRCWDDGGTGSEPPTSYEEVQGELVEALLAFDRPRAEQSIRRLMGTSFATIVDDVLVPLANRVRRSFAAGKVSVAQEHHVGAFVRDRLIAMLLSVGCGPETGTHAGCSTIAGDHDEVPALALAVRLALAGCRVTYLGASLDAADLAGFARDVKPAYLCVTAGLAVDEAAVVVYASELRAAVAEPTRICISSHGLPVRGGTPVAGVQLVRDWHEVEVLAA